MQSIYFPAADRGKKDGGWLKSNFTFSFSNYYNPVKSAFGTLITFNDDFVEPGKGFGLHPHINMEIISVLLKGKMNHKDNMGYSTLIGEGGVQIMSAGSGLKHEEYNVGEEEVNFLQIWILPKQDNIMPRYQLRHFPIESRRNKLVTIVSHEEGLDHCWINQNAKLSLGYFDQGQQIDYKFPMENKCLFIFTISGSLFAEGQEVKRRDAIGFWQTGQVSIITREETEFLIIETVVNQK
jgi:redox-sensitive bicupin YhaK (pirin superfamily)